MFEAVSASTRWFLALGGKFLRVAPGPTLLTIPATLVSQVATLLAFLLPIKVLILVGSDGIPRYFANSFMQFDRDTLIVALSIATPAFYLLHLAMEQLVLKTSNIGAKRLLARSRKIVLFENQDDLATASYRRYAEALANTVFIACVWLLLGFVFPLLCLLLVSYTLICIVGLGIAHRCSETLGNRIEESLSSLVAVLTSIGFMLAFLLLIQQFLVGAIQVFFIAIISLLLTRQTLNRTKRLVTAIVNLYSNRRKLNALFFTEHSLSQNDELQEEFWAMFSERARDSWLRELLTEHLAINPNRLNVNWHQTGVNDLVALEVLALDSSEKRLGRYLVQVYGKRPTLSATHEATLLLDESSEHLPAFPLLAAGQVGKWHCHIFPLTDKFAYVHPAQHTKSLLSSLWAFEPPADLAERYTRSHPMLWQRLDTSLIERLYMVAGEDNATIVRSLEEQLPDILFIIRSLPLTVVNPDININTLIQDDSGNLNVTYWGRWTLEPVGSDWPVGQRSLQELSELLQQASEIRPALREVDPQAVALSALLFKLDWLCTKQLYLDALKLIPELLKEVRDVLSDNQGDSPLNRE